MLNVSQEALVNSELNNILVFDINVFSFFFVLNDRGI